MIKKLITLFTILFSIAGIAQKSNSSPYSYFGIGEPASLKSVEEIAMGKMGGVLNSEYQLSFTNPATYGSLQWTTYVFSGGNKLTKFDVETTSDISSQAGFTYLALGIPIRGNQGLAFGLQLNTSVGYSLLDTNYDEDDVLIETTQLTGNGGTNRVFVGYGYKFPFGLNLGGEAGYIFGGIDNNILNRRLGVQLATKHRVESYVKGFEFKGGALYETKIKNDLQLKFGASFTFGHELEDRGDEFLITLDNTGEPNARPKDTLYTKNYLSTVKYPVKSVLSAGVGKKNKWFVGAEYTFMNAIDFKGVFFEEQDFYDYVNTNMISVGGFYTPKFNSLRSYFERLTYRAGFYYNNMGLAINDTQIKDYGISFGVSLPVSLNISNVNFGIELGKRGEPTGGLIEEKYFNFRLSLSLNDKWFRKRKLN